MKNKPEITEVLNELEEQLHFWRELGVEFLVKPEPAGEDKKSTAGSGEEGLVLSVPGSAPSLSEEALEAEWDKLIKRIMKCTFCPLYKGRTQAVPGEGNRKAELMFVGEAPGRDEDIQGRPFVGRAGQLLTRIIQAMGFEREQVYIANVIKCRPPENRTPKPDEVRACSPYLVKQIELVKPRVIVALGKVAAEFLLQTSKSMSELRGNFGEYAGIPVMPTFHPSYLVRNEGNKEIKKMVWEDMKKVLKVLGR